MIGKRAISFILELACCTLWTASSYAATYYVDNTVPNCSQNGNVTPCCSDTHTTAQNSQARPWCTITKANTTHAAGDTVLFKGEFREVLDPKSGLSNEQRTVYSGYTNDRTQAKVLGSRPVSGWQRCDASAGCPVTNNNIYRASFDAPDQCRGGDPRVIIKNTNCYIDRQRGLIRSVDNPFVDRWNSNPNYDNTGEIFDLNANEEFHYDQQSSLLYVYMTSNPDAHQIECVVGRNLVLGTHPFRYVDIKNLTLMQTNNHVIAFGDSLNAGNVTIENNEIAFTGGEGYCSENPSAIYTAAYGYSPVQRNVAIRKNLIHDIGSDKGPWNDARIYSATHSGAAMTVYSLSESIVEENEIYNTFQAIGMKGGNANYTIRNNIIHHADEGIWIGPPGPRGMTAPVFAGSVYGNLIHNLSAARSNGLGIYSNRGYTIMHIFGNTLYNTKGLQITNTDEAEAQPEVYATVKNNIVSSLLSTSHRFIGIYWNGLANLDSNFNLFYDTKPITNFAVSDINSLGDPGATLYATLAIWKTQTAKDINSNYQDPLFSNVANSNFSLQTNSPARNTGTFISGHHCASCGIIASNCRTWYGSSPDQGAFEFVEPCVGDNSPPAAPDGLQVQ